MKKFFYVAVLVAVSLMSACGGKGGNKTFDEYGISFSYPSDWEITDTEDDDLSTYVCVEKKGFDPSGIVIISVIKEEMEQDEFIDFYSSSFIEEDFFDDLNVTPVSSGNYGKYPVNMIEYTGSVEKYPHRGRISMFVLDGRSVSVMEQEATEDTKANKEGFETIESTLEFK